MRREGWEARLAGVLEDARSRPYALGEHDCFRLACAAVAALTGEDRWPIFAGRYSTKREAMRLLATHGANFEAAFDWFFAAPSIDVRLARMGDIVMIQSDDGEKHLGVCNGVTTAALGEHGLLFVPTLNCLRAWRIG